MKTPRSAFTLIELLVVIAILGILMSLLFPAVNSAMDAAKKTQAQNTVTQIALAVRNYETEYGKPLGNGPDEVKGSLVEVLTGSTNATYNNNKNPRGIVFLEVNAWKKNRGGTNAGKYYLDPFGDDNSKNVYKITFAPDYGNTIPANALPSFGNSSALMAKVAVWMQTNARFNGNNKKPAMSW